jgi:hypothetical protein
VTDAEAGNDGGAGEDAAPGAPVAPHGGTDAVEGGDAAKVTDAPGDAPVVPVDAGSARATLRQAASAVLAAWDDEANRGTEIIAALEAPMATLRRLLDGRTPRPATDAARKPREGTKQQAAVVS